MANSHSFRNGQRQLVKVRVDSSTVIEIGDMVYLDTDDAKPASAFTWNTNLATTQAGFADVFLGIAAESSASGQTTPISVDVSSDSVYEFACASATHEIGDKLGPAANTTPSPDQLEDQILATATGTSAIGHSREYKAAAVTKLHCSFHSAYFGHNTNAVVG